jgi:hypothetical protein
MRDVAIVVALGLTTLGCGAPSREAAVEERLARACDAAALHEWRRADVHIAEALRLAPFDADAHRLRDLVREQETSAIDRTGGIRGGPSPRLPRELQEAGRCEPAWLTDLRATLGSRKVTVNFPETPLTEVVSFLSDITGLAIGVSPLLDGEELTVSLRLRDVFLGDTLRIIAEQTETVIVVHDGTLTFRSP